ncbi:MAG: high-affinity branched-chain amino acid ABC transporter ATP-binding protein LivG [Desulfuromonas sp.]|uniref:ABC transporter ATP-binding protein n=1 Tax=Desulfuromonas sp. TaxID=892 RepID=UPI000CC47495|nr:ABC transporter ATP-binding protein [Desulfuromonas sp.]PLX82334.1 MAG: high-affinity branched-chain amino acid ABC transporter ATP-binding protein LivG [Desulfuromonas sp.]
MLRLAEIGKRFGGLPALDGVSFEVARGSVTALIGPNGAGKSTLINAVSGVCPPDTGSVLFAGEEIAGRPPHEIARLGIARTFQNLRLFPRMSVLDNVLCGLTPQGGRSFVGALLRLPATRNRERRLKLLAMESLDAFGLSSLSDWPVAVLPYGDRKRVELARAFVSEPRLVLLDEPVAGLNPEETSEIAAQIMRLKAQGHTMLLVEHDMDLVMGVADRVVVLDSGKCIARGTPDEIRVNPLVLEAYLGRMSATA